MITKYISAGHGAGDLGACCGEFRESDLALDFAKLVCEKINAAQWVPQEKLAKKIAGLTKLVKLKDCAIDIHFNAGGGTGCEVVVPEHASETEKAVASTISQLLAEKLGVKNRGVKKESDTARGKLAWMTLPCESILVEVCFLDNHKDMENFNKNKLHAVDALATYLNTI